MGRASAQVEEKKAQQEELQLQRRQILEKRLQRAAEKREMQLKNKVKRAHDEEEKVGRKVVAGLFSSLQSTFS